MLDRGSSAVGLEADATGSSAHVAERLAAFAAAYDDHSAAIYTVARWVCGPTAADEVTRRVFARLWRRPELYHPVQPSLRTALLTVLHREAEKAPRTESATGPQEPGTNGSTSSGSSGYDERTPCVRCALDALPRAERVAIATTYFGRCTYQEAAVVLGQPEATIKALINAGLRKLPVEPAPRQPA